MGDYVTKKRAPAAETHLELFSSQVEEKRPTNGTVEDFCLYRTESVELKLEHNDACILKDKPAKQKPTENLERVTYKAPRKPSAHK